MRCALTELLLARVLIVYLLLHHHLKVVVVSTSFEGVKLIDRHRKINSLLNEELASGVHALSIIAKTPKQWEDSGENPGKSPPCRGGMGL